MRITSKGQVTIPQEIRDELGLLPNTEVTFAVVDGEARLRKADGHNHLRGHPVTVVSVVVWSIRLADETHAAPHLGDSRRRECSEARTQKSFLRLGGRQVDEPPRRALARRARQAPCRLFA
jgi:AbrB family looped-hinge helix DNA binding protein